MRPAEQSPPSSENAHVGASSDRAPSLNGQRPKTPGNTSAAPARSLRRWRIAGYILPMLVVLLAFALRVHRLPEVPFGWHPDEASKGLLARDVLAGKYAPAFFSAFTGRDALYVYLEALTFFLFGEGMVAARLLSAFAGVLTVAASYGLGRTMFGRRVGLVAAALLGASLWHLIASRNAYRAVIQPLVQIPLLWLLFQEWRRGEGKTSGWRVAAVAGLFLGLSQYTYTAARAFPVMVLILLALAWAVVPSLIRRRWQWLLAMLLVAAVVLVPLALYSFRHPFDLYGRAAQVSVFTPEWSGGDAWGRLRRSVVETARMFFIWGDPNYRFNIAGKPVFGAVGAVAFCGGIAVCTWSAVRCKGWRRLAYASLLIWLVVMLLPMTLSAESLPYYQRAIGILPVVYLLPALFLDTLAGWASSLGGRLLGRADRGRSEQNGSRIARALTNVLLGVLIAALTVRTARAYFGDWHTNPRNDDDRRVAMVYAASYLREETADSALYLSSEYPEHPTLAFLAPERYDGAHWFDAQQSLPLPPAGREATYVLLLEKPPQPALLERVPALQRVHAGHDRFGRPVFDVYHWPGRGFPVPADQSPAIWSFEVGYDPGDPDGLRHPIELPVSFGDTLAFTGHDRSADVVAPGDMLELVLHWQLLRRPERHYSMFAHLLDVESRVVAEYDANRYPTSFWREGGGELLLSYFPLRIDPGTPAGEYRLEIGVYHQPTGERLPVTEAGVPVADRLLLRPVTVQ